MGKSYVIKGNNRYYKVETLNSGEDSVLLTRLNSANPNDIFKPLDSFEDDLNTVLKNGYEIIDKGGKKTRSNKKYKKKSKTKRRRRHR